MSMYIMDGYAHVLYFGTTDKREVYLGKKFNVAKLVVAYDEPITKDYKIDLLFADNDDESETCKPKEFSIVKTQELCNTKVPYDSIEKNSWLLAKDEDGDADYCRFPVDCLPKPWVKVRISEVAEDGKTTEVTTAIAGLYIVLMVK